MLRSNSKQSGGIHVVNAEEEKERLRWEGFVLIYRLDVTQLTRERDWLDKRKIQQQQQQQQ